MKLLIIVVLMLLWYRVYKRLKKPVVNLDENINSYELIEYNKKLYDINNQKDWEELQEISQAWTKKNKGI